MTRVNVIPVSELSDQHLVAEYRELPRVLKQNIDISNAPDVYCFGKGHMKWAKKFDYFTAKRYLSILDEMEYRGLHHNYTAGFVSERLIDYIPTDKDIEINRERIRQRYLKRPDWYRWTKRDKPTWL